jgi:uncharacterized protein (TIGR02301 family)
MLKQFLAFLILIAACNLVPARAQDAAAPFDGDLQRLAEILGTLHYLRGICGTNEGAKWRNEMQALVDAETPPARPRPRWQSAATSRKARRSRGTSRRVTRIRGAVVIPAAYPRHCEQSEAIHSLLRAVMDCRVAALLAMTL